MHSIYCLHSKVFYTAALRQGELISQPWSQYSYDEQQNASMKIQELISNFTSYDKSAISLNVKGLKGKGTISLKCMSYYPLVVK